MIGKGLQMRTMKVSMLSLLVACSALAAKDVQTVDAVGEAAIVNNDEVKARDEAKKAALRNAVEQVAGTLVSADTLTENSQLVSDRIFTNATGYVKKYSSPQFKKDGGVVTCSLKADVAVGTLDKDLQAIQSLVRSLQGKKMVVVLQEQVVDRQGVITQSSVMAEVLSDALKKDGWTLIDPAFVSGKLKLAAGATMGQVEAKEIGNLTKADYILYGQAGFRQQEPPLMFKGSKEYFPVTGEYSLTVFATDSGSQIGVVTGKLISKLNDTKVSQVHSYSRTMHDLVRSDQSNILGNMRKAIYAQLQSDRQNGNRVVVDVLGLPDYDAVTDFKQVLAARSGVNGVEEGSFEGGKANYEVTLLSNTSSFAQEFRKATFKGKKISVTGRSNNRVELTVAK